MQLASATLPIGAYAFSQGMESATERGVVNNIDECRNWLRLLLQETIAHTDLPILLRLYRAHSEADHLTVAQWDGYSLACRETGELRLAESAMAEAMRRLLRNLSMDLPERGMESYLSCYAWAATQWRIAEGPVLLAWSWAWLENQVAAATKLVPLGQSAAQQLLSELQAEIPGVVSAAITVADDDIGNSLPMLAMLSSWHETQYSRLFRS